MIIVITHNDMESWQTFFFLVAMLNKRVASALLIPLKQLDLILYYRKKELLSRKSMSSNFLTKSRFYQDVYIRDVHRHELSVDIGTFIGSWTTMDTCNACNNVISWRNANKVIESKSSQTAKEIFCTTFNAFSVKLKGIRIKNLCKTLTVEKLTKNCQKTVEKTLSFKIQRDRICRIYDTRLRSSKQNKHIDSCKYSDRL